MNSFFFLFNGNVSVVGHVLYCYCAVDVLLDAEGRLSIASAVLEEIVHK